MSADGDHATLVASELDMAERRQRAAEAGGFWLDSVSLDRDTADAISELAAEREAIRAESAERSEAGLVSVPTSGHSDQAAAYRLREASKRMRSMLRCVEAEKAAARIARMRRSVGFTARALLAGGHRRGWRPDVVKMITLTYRDGGDWRPRHLSACLKHLRRWLSDQGIPARYVWVAELQRRGAIHYHIATWVPAGVRIPFLDQSGWWLHGSSNVVEARKAVPYLMKYMSKGTTFAGFPRGARTYGSGGVEHALRRARRWLGLPKWVQSRSDIADDWRRAVGGGWSDPDGFVIPSTHARAYVGDRWCLVRVADYPPVLHVRPIDGAEVVFEPSGPFSWWSR